MHLLHQLAALTCCPASGSPVIVMVQPTQDRKSNDLVPCILRGRNQSEPFRNLLRNPLMGSCLVEVDHIAIEHALELLLLQDQQMVETFLPYAPQEPFTQGVGSWGMNRRFEQLDATGRRYSAETGSILAVVITDQILGCLTIRRGFPEVLVHPGIGRRSCYSHVNHLARLQLDNEEREEWSKEEIRDVEKIAGPHPCRMIAQKGFPGLSTSVF